MMAAALWVLRNWRLVLIGAAVFGLGMFGLRFAYMHRQLAKERAKVQELESYRTTRRKTDAIDDALRDDPGAARRAMRERKPPKH